ncbi:MAG: hypothetical protein IKU18_03400 [Bacteroidales bacterium]|nr:hypothetical protein [Bacteroidales bacterium]
MSMDYILKSNLWKFFKSLRVQANQIYCMLVASPVDYAWITVVDKNNSNEAWRVSIAQFVGSLRTMPSVGKYYKLNINLYLNGKESCFEASVLSELSVERVEGLFVGIVAYHCKVCADRGTRLELTPQILQHYRFKKRYVADLQAIIDQCNATIPLNNQKSQL